MGGGRYLGYEDWHPAVLTLGCAYQAMKVRTFSELQPLVETSNQCRSDDLRQKNAKADHRQH